MPGRLSALLRADQEGDDRVEGLAQANQTKGDNWHSSGWCDRTGVQRRDHAKEKARVYQEVPHSFSLGQRTKRLQDHRSSCKTQARGWQWRLKPDWFLCQIWHSSDQKYQNVKESGRVKGAATWRECLCRIRLHRSTVSVLAHDWSRYIIAINWEWSNRREFWGRYKSRLAKFQWLAAVL